MEGSGLAWSRVGKYIIIKREDGSNPAEDAHLARKVPNLLNPAIVVGRRDGGTASTFAGSLELPQNIIRHSPAVFGEADVLKTLQLMPGVSPGMEGFSGIHVRGGGQDENLLMLDGVPLYNVNHTLGMFSSFTPESVSKVTMYKGAFPARYGGRISSIIAVRTASGNEERMKGSVSIGLLSEKLHLEGPLPGGATFSLSARGTHTLLLDGPIRWLGSPLNYGFYDLDGRISFRPGASDRIDAGIYHGRDRLDYENEASRSGADSDGFWESRERVKMDIRYGNTLAAINWNHVSSGSLRWRASLYCSDYDMLLDNRTTDTFTRNEVSETRSVPFRQGTGILDAGARMDFDWSPSTQHLVTFGADAVLHHYRPQITSQIPDDIFGKEASLYMDDDILIGGHLTLNAGLRTTLFNVQGHGYLSAEPRLSGRYAFDRDWSAKASYARMTQYVHLLTTGSLSMPTDLWVPITGEIRPEACDIFSAGLFHTGLEGWEFSLEGWWKRIDGVIVYKDVPQALSEPDSWQKNVSTGLGRSWGSELFARKTFGKTTGSLSYTLSWSERMFPDGSVNGGRWFPYTYDRRHNFNITVNHRFNERIELSALWLIMSGTWFTVPESQTFVLSPDSGAEAGYNTWTRIDFISSKNNYRLPPSHRLDVSARFHKMKKRGERVWEVGVYNLYNAMNPNIVWLWTDGNSQKPEPSHLEVITVFTLMPSVSYTFNF